MGEALHAHSTELAVLGVAMSSDEGARKVADLPEDMFSTPITKAALQGVKNLVAKGGKVDINSLKLLYYPDVKKLEFRYKIVLFADRILDKNNREEREMAERIRSVAEPGDMNRLKMFLDKTILRLENSFS
jgi:hypothetical protein